MFIKQKLVDRAKKLVYKQFCGIIILYYIMFKILNVNVMHKHQHVVLKLIPSWKLQYVANEYYYFR